MRALQNGLLIVLTAVIVFVFGNLLLGSCGSTTQDTAHPGPTDPGATVIDGQVTTGMSGLERVCVTLGGSADSCRFDR